MNKENISLIINCQKGDIENINMAYFNDKYVRVYFNIKPDNKEYLSKIINNIETKYYSIWDYNSNYQNINNLNVILNYNYQDTIIGIYYIATNIYINDFNRFLISIKNFFPNIKKEIILLTNSELNILNINNYPNISINYHKIDDFPWPIITLFKMKYIYDYKGNYDYVFYFNANSELLNTNYSWFDPTKINVSIHKDWLFENKNNALFLEPFMDNPNSTSYIGTLDYIYVQGAFFGGPAQMIYDMCKIINEMLTIDLQNNIIPRYHDETYLNKYCLLFKEQVNISNVFISEIHYDINNLKDLQETQFIILHENIYNLSDNNKTDKFSNFISFQNIKPLYNDIENNINDYCSYIDKTIYNGKSLICIFINYETSIEDIYKYYALFKYYIDKYHILFIYDDRTETNKLNLLYQLIDSQNMIGYNVLDLLAGNYIEPNNVYNYSTNYINILFHHKIYNHIYNNYPDFNKLYIIDKSKLSIDYINHLFYINDINYDLYVSTYQINNYNQFINNQITKKYKLFKHKFKFINHYFINNSEYVILSNRAYTYIYTYKDEIKQTTPEYYIPTIIKNNNNYITNIKDEA